jgi:GLPGLI family protein
MSYSLIYEVTIKTLEDKDQIRVAYMSVVTQQDSTICQWYEQRKLDSISSLRRPTEKEIGTYYKKDRYLIQMNKNKLTFSEQIAKTRYFYEEEIGLDWEFGKKEKLINGYLCNNAFVTYGGRNWEAWYSKEVPVNTGPYKFSGLPGLIVKISDSNQIFTFQLSAMRERADLNHLVYTPFIKDYQLEKTSRLEFNAAKKSFNSLSFGEKINFINRDNPDHISMKLTSDDDSSISSLNSNQIFLYNYIEIDK